MEIVEDQLDTRKNPVNDHCTITVPAVQVEHCFFPGLLEDIGLAAEQAVFPDHCTQRMVLHFVLPGKA